MTPQESPRESMKSAGCCSPLPDPFDHGDELLERVPERHTCVRCNEDFDENEDLQRHLDSNHSFMSCLTCGKQFARDDRFVYHYVRHRGGKVKWEGRIMKATPGRPKASSRENFKGARGRPAKTTGTIPAEVSRFLSHSSGAWGNQRTRSFM
jgi:uncharacterized Zn-finger protein